mmetsp:Transcript_77894/g.232107  ORF Transcript_77894/g.232107 Transcript_77894/m.232107 type:complete len:202 (+) Transcript_77894:678-1283(+)
MPSSTTTCSDCSHRRACRSPWIRPVWAMAPGLAPWPLIPCSSCSAHCHCWPFSLALAAELRETASGFMPSALAVCSRPRASSHRCAFSEAPRAVLQEMTSSLSPSSLASRSRPQATSQVQPWPVLAPRAVLYETRLGSTASRPISRSMLTAQLHGAPFADAPMAVLRMTTSTCTCSRCTVWNNSNACLTWQLPSNELMAVL